MSGLDRNFAETFPKVSSHKTKIAKAERLWPITFRAIEPLAIVLDVVAILLSSLFAAWLARMGGSPIDFGQAFGAAVVVSALMVCILKLRGSYRPAELLELRNQARSVLLAWMSVFVILAAALSALDPARPISRGLGLFAVLGVAGLIVLRFVTKKALVTGLRRRKFAGRKVVLITDHPKSSTTGPAHSVERLGFMVARSFWLPPPGAGIGVRKRLSADVIDYVRGSDIEEIIIESDLSRWSELRLLAADLRILPSQVNFVPVGAAAEVFRRRRHQIGGAVCVEFQRGPLSRGDMAAKRTLDILGAGLALMLLMPLLAVVAIAIRLDSPGPIFFRQQRCGFNGRKFAICKFRTMHVLEDGQSVVQAGPRDKRVTRVGRWLRRTSIDELPQLLNVLDGSMCLVGPRPHAIAHDNEFDKILRNYAFRRRVKPGLTGWAQVHGCRGPTPTRATIERRVEYDLWYIDNWSLRLDLLILLQTPLEVTRARNAF
ncbi:undecaprenyl-phosphate glucose phosphotransferase [Rhodoblastus sphagnicola]|uniref:Undecaprenyl-phosphate glucose phosphotransferase n=1 Tax=Rhodoblastus sphagnicola TaxID=333368 RepID=A0A2S6N195_9HYPH|nr:exopolysaccharide biosynthesis polyprenyl glycosylphosphotransferase [Rhodoblastus sphagnicola]MBB4200393.1 putative colanic acid biosynthesis UDP-glucose lipid carrier transferase [Rhodoblastus sphagnicola]PPQ28394.1 undecaprenyl-phosphate glucose phosphotransferase [Rhodoblastus sphagnicola]